HHPGFLNTGEDRSATTVHGHPLSFQNLELASRSPGEHTTRVGDSLRTGDERTHQHVPQHPRRRGGNIDGLILRDPVVQAKGFPDLSDGTALALHNPLWRTGRTRGV